MARKVQGSRNWLSPSLLSEHVIAIMGLWDQNDAKSHVYVYPSCSVCWELLILVPDATDALDLIVTKLSA